VLFVFGKLNSPKGNELRNKLEIYFPALYFVKQLWKSSRDFHRALAEFVDKNGYVGARPGSIAETPDKVQTLQSNNVLMVLSGG
jgi:hypothetical protein